jgi:TolB protein
MPDAQVRVTGSVTRQADGHIKVEFRLGNGDTQLAGQQYFSTASNSRRTGTIISNAVYERLTGEKANFNAP